MSTAKKLYLHRLYIHTHNNLPEVSPEEYLRREELAEYRSEYIDGRIYPVDGGVEAMAGGSLDHNRISLNMLFALKLAAKGKNCEAFNSDTKLWVETASSTAYFYPDGMLVCKEGLDKIKADDKITKPRLIIEVVSATTEKKDRDTKFKAYSKIDSLKEYILITQDHVLVECYYRDHLEEEWRYRSFNIKDELVELYSIQTQIAMVDIYENVSFVEVREEANDQKE